MVTGRLVFACETRISRGRGSMLLVVGLLSIRSTPKTGVVHQIVHDGQQIRANDLLGAQIREVSKFNEAKQ